MPRRDKLLWGAGLRGQGPIWHDATFQFALSLTGIAAH